MWDDIVRVKIAGAKSDLDQLRDLYLVNFPSVEKNDPEEFVAVFSGDRLDPRPTLLNLSCEFEDLTFTVIECVITEAEERECYRWEAKKGEARYGSSQ